MDTMLYETMMFNAGKSKNQIWEDIADKFINEVYLKDYKIYGSDTKDLYVTFFPENESLFESVNKIVKEATHSLNEDSSADIYAGEATRPPFHTRGPSNRGMPQDILAILKPGATKVSTSEQGVPPKIFSILKNKAESIGNKPEFLAKIKSFFTGAGSLLKTGIAGIIANPWPLIAAGVGVGVIIALIRKFKKLSDEKKNKALASLDKKGKTKVELMLAKDESELKKELEKKGKK